MEKTNREKAVSGQINPDDKKEINDYLDGLKLDEAVPVKDFKAIVKKLVGSRGLFVYFVWKVLKEKGLDADKLVQEACFRWGEFNGKKMGDIRTPKDFMKKLSSKGGTLAWDQEYKILNDKVASKEFYSCPHVEAFKQAGATEEEVAMLCKELMCYGDYGTASPHPIKLEWAEPTIGEGGKRCVMMITCEEK